MRLYLLAVIKLLAHRTQAYISDGEIECLVSNELFFFHEGRYSRSEVMVRCKQVAIIIRVMVDVTR
jgi:hypothetical protein